MNSLLFEFRHLFIWVLISLFFAAVVSIDPFPETRLSLEDAFFFETSPRSDIVLVKIDDRSLNKIGQWPWPRATFAELINRLEKASVIGIDVSFREPSRFGERDDQQLAQAIEQSAAPVVLSAPFRSAGQETLSIFDHAYYGFSDVLIDSDGKTREMVYWQENMPSFAYAVSLLTRKSILEPPPPGSSGPIRINYRGGNETYPAFSFTDVLDNPDIDELFDGKVILVGVTASDLRNFQLTPFGFISGVETQANKVDTVLEDSIYYSSKLVTVATIIILIFLAMLSSIYIRRLYLLLLTLGAIIVLYIVVIVIGFANFLILDPLYPSMAVVATVMVTSISQYLVISERERIVRRSFTYLAAMVESMNDGVVLVDNSHRIRVLNKTARSLFKVSDRFSLSLEECARKLPSTLNLKNGLKESRDRQSIIQLESVLIDDSYYQIFIDPIGRETIISENLGSVIIFHDITHEKEVERLREDFISMMVHELRSPLDAIKKLMEALRGGDIDKADRRSSYLSLVHTNASQMLLLVNDLLDVAKIEAGKFEIKPEPTDLRKLFEERTRFFEGVAKDKKITLELYASGDVPPEVSLDGMRINQVLNNLLSNSLKFSAEQGRVKLWAYITSEGVSPAKAGAKEGLPEYIDTLNLEPLADKSLTIAVSDTGNGISKEKLPQLFNKFRQFEESRTSAQKGTGLGLAIVKGIAEAHQGKVAVASDKGKGSIFYVSIPLSQIKK
ncbi:MAG: CHASE2 domain-containing protein [Candidatus Zambryskibacteria bacterium]|nr:CHASE2 domain-containing protein [Candidatus Zambryskibacteria bacterium]